MESPRYLGRPLSVGDLKLPFSEAVSVGQMLYLSGSIGLDDSGSLVSGGIEAETNQVLVNVRTILERHGSSMERVIRCTVMLVDMADWAAMNSVYIRHFTTNLPARSAFGTTGLALGARVEIECTALVG